MVEIDWSAESAPGWLRFGGPVGVFGLFALVAATMPPGFTQTAAVVYGTLMMISTYFFIPWAWERGLLQPETAE